MLFHDHPEHHAAHAGAALGHKQVVGLLAVQDGRARLTQVARNPVARYLAKRHQALLAALAQHAQHAFVHADVEGLERDQLAHAQAAGVHQLQHGAVAQAQRRIHVGRAQQQFHLRLRQCLGHAQRLAGRLQLHRRVGVMKRSRSAQRK
jgi:hypothetical protein